MFSAKTCHCGTQLVLRSVSGSLNYKTRKCGDSNSTTQTGLGFKSRSRTGVLVHPRRPSLFGLHPDVLIFTGGTETLPSYPLHNKTRDATFQGPDGFAYRTSRSRRRRSGSIRKGPHRRFTPWTEAGGGTSRGRRWHPSPGRHQHHFPHPRRYNFTHLPRYNDSASEGLRPYTGRRRKS